MKLDKAGGEVSMPDGDCLRGMGQMTADYFDCWLRTRGDESIQAMPCEASTEQRGLFCGKLGGSTSCKRGKEHVV